MGNDTVKEANQYSQNSSNDKITSNELLKSNNQMPNNPTNPTSDQKPYQLYPVTSDHLINKLTQKLYEKKKFLKRLSYHHRSFEKLVEELKKKENYFQDYQSQWFRWLFIPSSIGFVSFKLLNLTRNSKKLFTSASQGMLVYLLSKEISVELTRYKKRQEIIKDPDYALAVQKFLVYSGTIQLGHTGSLIYYKEFHKYYDWFTYSSCVSFAILKLCFTKSISTLKLGWTLIWQTMLFYLIVKNSKDQVFQYKFKNDVIKELALSNGIQQIKEEKIDQLEKDLNKLDQKSNQMSKILTKLDQSQQKSDKLSYKPTIDQQQEIKFLNSQYLEPKKD